MARSQHNRRARRSSTTGQTSTAQKDRVEFVKDDLSTLSYQQARDELIRVVTELEQGASSLEESIALWERGEALAKRCEEWLIGAKERLDAARAAATPE